TAISVAGSIGPEFTGHGLHHHRGSASGLGIADRHNVRARNHDRAGLARDPSTPWNGLSSPRPAPDNISWSRAGSPQAILVAYRHGSQRRVHRPRRYR